MSVFVANLGLRDVRVNVGDSGKAPRFLSCMPASREAEELAAYLGCAASGARHVGLELLQQLADDYGSARPRIRLPMLSPALAQAMEIARREGAPLEEVVLLATDQDPDRGGKHYHNDSTNLAHVVKKILETEQGLAVAVRTLKETPQRHDVAYTILRDMLPKKVKGLAFLLASGGVPAVNSASVELCLSRFDDRLRLLQPNEPRLEHLLGGGESTVERVPLKSFRAERLAYQVGRLLNLGYDYTGALELLRGETDLTREDRVLDPLVLVALQYGHARFNLDYGGAEALLASAPQEGPIPGWHQEVAELGLGGLLWDAIETAEVCWKQGRWTDFVWRIASVVENYWRWWAEKLEPSLPAAYIDRDGNPVTASRPGLYRGSFYIDSSRVPDSVISSLDGRTFKPRTVFGHPDRWLPGRALFEAIAGSLANGASSVGRPATSELRRLHGARERISRLSGIVNLRNDAQHLLRGISAGDVALACNPRFSGPESDAPKECRKALDTAKAAFSVTVGQFPSSHFRQVNEFVLSRLERVGRSRQR